MTQNAAAHFTFDLLTLTATRSNHVLVKDVASDASMDILETVHTDTVVTVRNCPQ